MDIDDLIEVYERKKKLYGNQTFKHMSDMLAQAKKQHRIDFSQSDTASGHGLKAESQIMSSLGDRSRERTLRSSFGT